MTALRIIDSHLELASIGTKTHAQIESHIQGIGNYAFPAADGGADQVLKTNGAGVLAWIDKNHSIASHSDTTATGAELETLTDNSIADALHRHSELVASDGAPDPALKVDATGQVGIGTATPSEMLQVVGGLVLVSNHSGGFASKDTGGVTKNLLMLNNADNLIIGYAIDSSKDVRLSPGSGAKLTIQGGGNVGIGTTSPAISAKLELSSTTGALLLTRMTTTQRNALTAVNGMLLYNSTLNKFQGYENGAWASLI